MKWPLVPRRRYEALLQDAERLRIMARSMLPASERDDPALRHDDYFTATRMIQRTATVLKDRAVAAESALASAEAERDELRRKLDVMQRARADEQMRVERYAKECIEARRRFDAAMTQEAQRDV